MKTNYNSIKIYDSGDTCIDRYTVIIGNDVYSMSYNADQPNGFNQYCFPVTELSYKYLDKCKRVLIVDLPKGVRNAIKQRIEG